MKDKWKIILIALVCVIAPVLIGMGVSADILNDWTNDNDWIGFWGSYAGAIMGGLITLYVMHYTIKNNEDSLRIERKKNFTDKILYELIEYHTGIDDLAGKISKNKSINMNEAKSLMILSEMLVIKLKTAGVTTDYIYCKEVCESLELVTKKFNELLKFQNENAEENCCDDIYVEYKNKSVRFINDIGKFYANNRV